MPPYTPENVYVMVYGISPQDVSEDESNSPHDQVAEARRHCEPDLDATVTDYGHNSLLDKPNTDPIRSPAEMDAYSPQETLQDCLFLLCPMLAISIDKQRKRAPFFKLCLADRWARGGRPGPH